MCDLVIDLIERLLLWEILCMAFRYLANFVYVSEVSNILTAKFLRQMEDRLSLSSAMTPFRRTISVISKDFDMGMTHSLSDGKTCLKDEDCFSILPSFAELMTTKSSPLASPSGQCGGLSPSDAVLETPKRQRSDNRAKQARNMPYFFSTRSSPTDSDGVEQELDSINRGMDPKEASNEDEFVLMDPKSLNQEKTRFLITEDASVRAAEPYSRPRLQPPLPLQDAKRDISLEHVVAAVHEKHHPALASSMVLDSDRRMQGNLSRGRYHFKPIQDAEDNTEDPFSAAIGQKKLSTRNDSDADGLIPAFKLKPRKSRRLHDGQFNYYL